MTIEEKTNLRISRLENDRDDLYEITVRIEAKLDALADEFRGFKTEMTAFKTEMLDFKTEMTAFKTEMTAFKAEMLDFTGEMLDFRTETTALLGEILRRLPEPPAA